ncbi:MAG: hypothetical protein H6R13_3643 [Proteobacteria bacterium]|nr:hypothetical protein [Pseudomonadota bacterium]
MEKWSNEQKLGDEWERLEQIGKGGQATTRKVRNKTTGEVACLKELNSPKDSERRARFMREATAYATCAHPGIPKLVQSNAQLHEEKSAKLFILIEFIPGKTLEAFINERGPVTLEDAAPTTTGLLEIATYLHSHGWIHRDIKHDNIILRHERLEDPVLIDFGLAYRDEIDTGFDTPEGQGLDNRFLRLPELSVNSRLKQDPRTDLAFFGGILFYMLTGRIPGGVDDGAARMPHQRHESIARLKDVGGNAIYRLFGFFDKTFARVTSERFESAAEMRAEFEAVLDDKGKIIVNSADRDLEVIKTALDSLANRQLVRNKALYDAAMTEITYAHQTIAGEVSPTYQRFQTGYVNFDQKFQNTLGFAHFSNLDKRFAPHFEMTIEGDELVIRADGAAFHRTAVVEPVFGDEFREKVRRLYITGLRTLI